MNVLVIGGTGFTGGFVVDALLAAGHQVQCFVRPTSNTSALVAKNVPLTTGDMADGAALTAALRGKDALIYVASLGFGHAEGVVNAVLASGVQRTVFVSTTALFTKLPAASKVVRVAAEKTITDSTLDYTIIRPTMIYGTPRDRNMCRLVRFIQRWPVIPVFGTGTYLQQPVHVADVAQAIVASLPNAATYRQAYNISGAAALAYNDVIDTVAAALNKRIFKLHLPVTPIIWGLTLTEKIGIRLPIKAEQILRLNEDKDFAHTAATQDFGYAPRDFATGIASEIELMTA